MFKRACVVLLLISASACHSSPTAPTASSIAVTGTVPSVGQTSQLTATVTLSNGTSQEVTAQATWSSSNTAVATVTTGGLLSVLQPGAGDITATYQSRSGQFSVSVVAPPPTLRSVSIAAPLSALDFPDATAQATATGTFSDGSMQNVTSTCANWFTDNPFVLTVSRTGRLTAHNSGTSALTTTCQGVFAHELVTLTIRTTAVLTVTLESSCASAGPSPASGPIASADYYLDGVKVGVLQAGGPGISTTVTIGAHVIEGRAYFPDGRQAAFWRETYVVRFAEVTETLLCTS